MARRLHGGRWWTEAHETTSARCISAPAVLQNRTPSDADSHPQWCKIAPHPQEVRRSGGSDYPTDEATQPSLEVVEARLRRDDPMPSKDQSTETSARPMTWTETSALEVSASAARESWSAWWSLLDTAKAASVVGVRSADSWFWLLTVAGLFAPWSAINNAGRMGLRLKRRELAEELHRRGEDPSIGLEWLHLVARDVEHRGALPRDVAARFRVTVEERDDAFRKRSRDRIEEGRAPLPQCVELARRVQPQKRDIAYGHLLPQADRERIAECGQLALQVQATRTAAAGGDQVAHRRTIERFRVQALLDAQRREQLEAQRTGDRAAEQRAAARIERLQAIG
jgi:hypothetical protein